MTDALLAYQDDGCPHLPGGPPPPGLSRAALHAELAGIDNYLWRIATGLYRQCEYMGLTPDDLPDMHAEGVIGALESGARFDPARGTKFTTYATFLARRRVVDWLRTRLHAGFRVPGRRNGRIRPLFVFSLGAAADLESPLDVPAPVPDPAPEFPADFWADATRGLDARSRLVVLRRFRDGRTLGDVGAELGLTQERVRQIQNRALARIRDTRPDLQSLIAG
jgi:DNA-directed RNA polymerase specialized sigma24 family protein